MVYVYEFLVLSLILIYLSPFNVTSYALSSLFASINLPHLSLAAILTLLALVIENVEGSEHKYLSSPTSEQDN